MYATLSVSSVMCIDTSYKRTAVCRLGTGVLEALFGQLVIYVCLQQPGICRIGMQRSKHLLWGEDLLWAV